MTIINANPLILVVGNIADWHEAGRVLPQISHTEFCEFSDLTAAFLARHLPDIILTSLVSAQFDVLDLTLALDELDYKGRVRAITPQLPNPDIILREVRFACPALDFDLIMIQPGPMLRSV